MSVIKVPQYVILLVGVLAVPLLKKVASALKDEAAKTPEAWDDVLAGAFDTVIGALETPGLFTPKT